MERRNSSAYVAIISAAKREVIVETCKDEQMLEIIIDVRMASQNRLMC